MSLDTESDSDSDIVITDMTFEDEGERYTRSIFFLSLIVNFLKKVTLNAAMIG